MYLLDTAVVLELRKAKTGAADPGLTSWASAVERQSLFLSALSLVELANGAQKVARKSRSDGEVLRRWIDDQLLAAFDGRILPVDAAVVKRRLSLPYADARDGLLAATALEHRLTLVTGNAAAFKYGRIKLFDPFGYRPEAEEEESDWRQAARTGPSWLKTLFVRG